MGRSDGITLGDRVRFIEGGEAYKSEAAAGKASMAEESYGKVAMVGASHDDTPASGSLPMREVPTSGFSETVG